MKQLLVSLIFIGSLLFSFSALADKVIIRGIATQPTFTAVTAQGDAYMVSTDVRPVSGYYFLSFDNTNKVCFTKRIAHLESVTPYTIKFKEKGRSLFCYDYNPDVFVFQR